MYVDSSVNEASTVTTDVDDRASAGVRTGNDAIVPVLTNTTSIHRTIAVSTCCGATSFYVPTPTSWASSVTIILAGRRRQTQAGASAETFCVDTVRDKCTHSSSRLLCAVQTSTERCKLRTHALDCNTQP
mmetsp:Transcript_11757/g.25225  ORF Transcript_11757/g.25225 Transcript_11757/m.25225 type:complete len:130 (-) Transcript_11757:145-534(-)